MSEFSAVLRALAQPLLQEILAPVLGAIAEQAVALRLMEQQLRDLNARLSREQWNAAAARDAVVAAELARSDPSEATAPDAVPDTPRGAPAAVAVTAAAKAVRHVPAAHGMWLTADRADILKRGWPAGTETKVLRAQMEALPGGPLPDNSAIAGTAAQKLGLRRPAWFRPNLGRAAAVAAPAPQAESPAPPAVAAPGPVAPGPVAPGPVAPAPVATIPAAVRRAPAAVPDKPDFRAVPAFLNAPGAAPGQKIEAKWRDISDWAASRKLRFDGDMLPVNAARQRAGLPELVLVEPTGPGSTPSRLAPAAA